MKRVKAWLMGFFDKIKKGGAETQIAIGVVLLFVVGVMSIGVAASAFPTAWGDPAIPTTGVGGTGGMTCAAWADAPDGYQALFTEAAAQADYGPGSSYQAAKDAEDKWRSDNNKPPRIKGISPALLGAIFLSEHGNDWSTLPAYDPNNPAPDALNPTPHPPDCNMNSDCIVGPFQFMVDTFESNHASGMTNINSLKDSAFAAANYIYAILKVDVGLKDSTPDTDLRNITDENYIRCVGAGYNGGGGMCSSWRDRNYGDPVPETDKDSLGYYHDRALTHFNNLNKGCDVLGIIPGSSGSMNLSGPSFHMIDYTGSRSSPWHVRQVGIEIIENGGYRSSTFGVTGTRSKAPCDSADNKYGCWKFEIFRPKDSELAGQIVKIAEAAAEKGIGIDSSLELSDTGMVSNCHYLIRYVKKELGFEITADNFEHKSAPSSGSDRLTIQPGDIVHFVLEVEDGNTVGYSFNRSNNQHWAIGDY